MALHYRSWRKSKSSKGLEVAMHMNYRQKLQQEFREEEEGFSFTSIKSHNHAAASSIISSCWLHDDQISRQEEVSRASPSPSPSPSRMSSADELFLHGKILPLNNTLHLNYTSINNDNHSNCNGTNYRTATSSDQSDISLSHDCRHHRRLLSISSSAPASPLRPADSIMDMLPHRPDQPRPPSGSTPRRRWWRSLSLFKRVPTHTDIQTADAPRPHLHTYDHAPHPHTPRPEDIFLASKVQNSNLAKGKRTTLQDYFLAPTEDFSQPLLQQCASPSNHLESSLNTHDHHGALPSSSPRGLQKTSLRRHHQSPPTRDLPKRSLSAHHPCTTPTKSHNKSLGAPHQGSNTSAAEGFHINRPTVRSRSLNISDLHVAGTINSTSQRNLATVCPNHATTSKAQQRPINVGTALHSLEVPPKGWIHAKGNVNSHQMSIAQGLPCPNYNVSSSCPSSPLYHWHTSVNKNTTSSPARSKSSIPSTSYNASHVEKLDTKGIKRKTYLPNHHVLLNCLSFNFVKLQYHFSKQQNPLVH